LCVYGGRSWRSPIESGTDITHVVLECTSKIVSGIKLFRNRRLMAIDHKSDGHEQLR
jgi:hypothetical protein